MWLIVQATLIGWFSTMVLFTPNGKISAGLLLTQPFFFWVNTTMFFTDKRNQATLINNRGKKNNNYGG